MPLGTVKFVGEKGALIVKGLTDKDGEDIFSPAKETRKLKIGQIVKFDEEDDTTGAPAAVNVRPL